MDRGHIERTIHLTKTKKKNLMSNRNHTETPGENPIVLAVHAFYKSPDVLLLFLTTHRVKSGQLRRKGNYVKRKTSITIWEADMS